MQSIYSLQRNDQKLHLIPIPYFWPILFLINSLAEEKKSLGNEAYKKGNYEEAYQLYTLALGILSNLLAITMNIMSVVKCKTYTCSYSNATESQHHMINLAIFPCIRIFQRSELATNNPSYLCNRAAALMMLNRHEEALDDAVRAIRIDDSYIKVWIIIDCSIYDQWWLMCLGKVTIRYSKHEQS